jgi:Spo0E like sporulation regulatory protein.
MEELRMKLEESIIKNGTLSPVTIKLSQELDILVVREQRKKVKYEKC